MQPHDPANDPLREALWRGDLTPAQRAQLESHLARHPEERGRWAEEAALTRALRTLPQRQAPSNLTARVLAAIDREPAAAPRGGLGSWLDWLTGLGWTPRLAGVALLVVAGFLGHHQYQHAQRAELARDVAEVSELAAAAPPVEVLQDFTPVRNLETVATPDTELLALLQ